MGLLDFTKDPEAMGLLSASAAMFNASGPSPVPRSFGQVAAAGLGGLLQSQQQFQESAYRDLKMKMAQQDMQKDDLQMEQMRAKSAQAQKVQDFLANRFGGVGNMPEADAQASNTALTQGAALGSIGPTVGNAQRMDAIQPPSQRQASNAFPFNLNEVTQLHAMGGPDLTAAFKLASEPFKYEANAMYKNLATGEERYMPKLGEGMTLGRDGAVSLAPNYIASNNAVKTGEANAAEQAKAGLDPFYGTDEKGNKVLLGSRLNALGGGFSSAGEPQQPGGNRGQGGIVTERSPAANAYDTDVAKDFASRYAGINKSGFSAPSQIAKLQRIGKLLEDHEGGKFSQTGLELAQYANSMGIKIDKNLSNKEAAAAVSNEIALSLRDPSNGAGMPGAMSDADRSFLASMAPGLAQSKDGRNQMINAGISVQKRNQQVADMARKYAKKYGKVDENFYDQLQSWSDRNQLFGGK